MQVFTFAIKSTVAFIIYSTLTLSIAHAAKVTPTDVFIEAKALKNALAATVNQEIGPSLLPLIDLDLAGAKPHHVYALSAALNEKLGIYMANKKISGFIPSPIPNQKITPANVKTLLLIAQKNFANIVPDAGLIYEPAKDKKPTDVMKEVTYANLWIDFLLQGHVKPAYPYLALQHIQYELKRLNQHLGLPSKMGNPAAYPKASPGDVFKNAENFYHILALYDHMTHQSVNPKHPYDISSSKIQIRPIHVYSLSIFNLFYLYSVEKRLGLDPDQHFNDQLATDIKPADVFKKYDQLISLLTNITSNAGTIR